MVCAYTLEHGRIALRFPGVNRADSKLKALSEPFAKSTARIYIRRNAAVGCVTGGKLECVYPNIRQDFKKMQLASHFCELFYRLTPDFNPNPDKFFFLENSLTELETAPSNTAIAPAFLLRLMQLSGFGLQDMPVLDIDEVFWEQMHSAPLSALSILTEKDLLNLNKTRYVCQRFLNRYLNYPLHTINQLDVSAATLLEQALQETALEPQLV
jgi:DNA repair protein RecO (recombination protein O)